MGDIKDCVQCMEPVYIDNGIPHWCDTYMMCEPCFYELYNPDNKKKGNYIVVRSHPEWCQETWGWKSEVDEIREDGGTLYDN